MLNQAHGFLAAFPEAYHWLSYSRRPLAVLVGWLVGLKFNPQTQNPKQFSRNVH